jgi:general secretion pathway protein N
MKKSWFGYLFLGVFAYLIFLVVTVPATWLSWGLARITHGTVDLNEERGSLWVGHGRLIVHFPRSTPRDLGQTEWRVNPLWLPLGRLQVSLKATGSQSDLAAAVGVTPKRIVLQRSHISVDANLASAFYAPARLLAPKGRLRFSADHLTLDKNGLHGNAVITWEGASSGLSSVQPLGDYRIDINGTGADATLKLTTLRGDLQLSGTGRWQLLETGDLQFNGVARPRSRGQELQSLLNLFGRDQGGGRRALRLRTRLPLLPLTPTPSP